MHMLGTGAHPGVACHSLSRLRASAHEGGPTWSVSASRKARASTWSPRPSGTRGSPRGEAVWPVESEPRQGDEERVASCGVAEPRWAEEGQGVAGETGN